MLDKTLCNPGASSDECKVIPEDYCTCNQEDCVECVPCKSGAISSPPPLPEECCMVDECELEYDLLDNDVTGEIKCDNWDEDYSLNADLADVEFDTGAFRENKEGKGRFDLISPIALRRLADVYELGANRYAPRNWEKGLPFSSCLNSALRHLVQWQCGFNDEDHLAHAAWNVFALIHLSEKISEGELSEDLNDLPDVEII